jgi:Mn2+/Fe2+ NRAMP family transporter
MIAGARTWRRFWSSLGPGLVSGAADDDPSGIGTYSLAGAQLGTSLLWTAWLTWPLMACVQMMCARIGLVTGHGLAAALKRRFPVRVLVLASTGLLAANTVNIAADLGAMADAAAMLTGWKPGPFVLVFGAGIAWAFMELRYTRIASVLKWLALALFAYVAAAISLGPRWSAVLRDAFLPGLPRTTHAWATLVAILGTTISPYLFFWQASQEVEEEKAGGRRARVERSGARPAEIADRRLDVGVGTFFSNLVMFFIILTTSLTLHDRAGKLETTRQIAEALRPIAGRFAELLYATGLIGAGLLAIPTLAGSAAYAFAETFRWRQGVDEKPSAAPHFYMIVGIATAVGIALDFLGVNPVRALFWSAVVNGVLAPFVLLGILAVAGDASIMNGQPSSRLQLALVGLAALLMFAALVGMVAL